MICVIYLITALHPLGQHFWQQPLLSLLPGHVGLDIAHKIDQTLGLKQSVQLATLPTNVAFMMFGAFGTVGNIVNRSAEWSRRRMKLTKQLLERPRGEEKGWQAALDPAVGLLAILDPHCDSRALAPVRCARRRLASPFIETFAFLGLLGNEVGRLSWARR
jgi:hypothetical protein